MKVTLELEESDLREMLEGYFKQNGFVIKNLESICETFTKAFPSGIQVCAEIGPTPVLTPASRDVPAEIEPQRYNDRDDVVDVAESTLSVTDLLDPTPRLRRTPAATSGDDSIARLVRASKQLEKK